MFGPSGVRRAMVVLISCLTGTCQEYPCGVETFSEYLQG